MEGRKWRLRREGQISSWGGWKFFALLANAACNTHTLSFSLTLVHDFVKMNPLYVVIQDVRKFMKETNEIVIMDFHRFPHGFEVGSMN